MATALKVGQIAIIGFNAGATLGGYTTEDRFHFVLLAPIEAGTQIFFTDRAWNGSSFTTGAGDGTFTYTAATNIAAGTVISITQAQLTAAGIDLSTSGDAIYVYQGTDANTPTKFLFAAEVADGNYTFNGSLVNTGLANGVSALAIAEDSGAYAGPTTDAYAHFFNNAGLLGNIVDASNWNTDEHGLNIAIDQHDQSGPFGTASDLSLWLAASGGGNGIASTNVDSTVSGGAVGYNLIIRYTTDTGDTVQTFANPRDIAFDTAEGKFFIIDSNAGGGTNVILQGNISDLIGNPSVPPTMTVLFSSSQATTLEKQIRDMQIDTINNIIYFTHGQRIEKIGYNTANQTSTVLATLGGTGSGNPFGTTNSGFADDFVIDFNSGTIYFSVHRVIAGEDGDAVSRNYVGKITGLTANSGANAFSWSGGQITVLPFSPDDNDTLHPLDLTGESFPQELGTVEGLALSPDGQTLYFTTASILWDHDGDGGYPTDGNPATTDPLLRMGGVYSYALSNNPNGAYTTIWQQADDGDTNSQAISTVYGPQGLLDDIEVDPVTGQLYFLDLTGDQLIINGVSQNPQGDEGVWRINADGSGLVFVQGVHNGTTNSNTLGAGSLFLNRAPVVTSSTQAVTGVIESSSTLSSGATALVQPFLSLDVTDAETASNPTQQLHSATVWISSNFQSGSTHQDRLTINGTTSGTINGVSYLYNSTTGVMTLTGAATFSVYEALIASVRFNTSGDDPTAYGAAPTRTISWTVSDGLNHSDPVTATVAVTGINDAPVITLANGIVGTSEDSTNFVLSGISVTDVDADPATQNVVATFSVPSGTLTLATNVAGGITAGQITAGANGSGTITVTATQNQINATLASGLTYTPPANHNGVRNLTVTVNDQGFNGNDPASTGTGTTEEGSAVLQISVVAVNDAPVVTGDGTESATTILEDTPSSTGQTVSELFGGQYSDPTDEVSGGSSAQAFAGVAIVGNGSSAATGQWQYWTGSAWADIGTASSASAKLISAATPLRFNPAQDYNGAAPTLTVHLIDASGAAITNGSTVNLSGVGGTGGTTRYSAGTVVLSQSVTAVNDAPVNTVPGARTASEDTAHAITGLSVSDVDADAATSLVTVTLRVLRGVLDIRTDVAGGVTAAQVSGDGGNVVTITATRSAINATFAASDGVVYQGPVNFNGFDTLTVTTNDQGTQGLDPGLTANALSEEDVDTVAITVVPVNDAPVVNGTGAVTINDIAEDVPTGFLAVSTLFLGQYSDPADESDTSNPQNPAGVVVVGNASSASTGQWQYWSGSAWINIGVVSNSAAMLIHVDAAIRFNPAPNYNGPAPTLTVRLVDESQGAITTGTVVNLSGAGAVGGTSRYSSGTISTSLNVLSLNDAPVLTAPDFTNILTENVAGPIFSSDSVVFSDVDSSDYAGGSLTVAKSSAIETLALRTTGAVTLSAGMTAGSVVSVNGVAVGVIATGGTGAGADNLVISLNANATAARMSTLVKELTYVSTENNPSLSATVNITLVDGDGRANGGDDDGSVTIGFYVNPVNDDPTLTSPVGLTADQNGVVTLTGFTIADIDSSGIFYVSLMTPTGAYTAPSVDGVSAVVNGQYLSLSGTL
ncbi:MAG TPA: hypothetical protein VD929_00955, partial [Caulobacteraceae bacterium]|nr:hypothetical protein [Caulobacteraceae bacterium]